MRTNTQPEVIGAVAVNTVYLSIDVVLTAALGMLFWIVAARFVPVQDLGEATIATTVATLFALTAGTRIAASKFIGEYKDKHDFGAIRRGVVTCAKITLLIGVGSMSIVFFVTPWLAKTVYADPALVTLLPIAALLIPLICIWDFLNGIFVGLQKAVYQLAVNTVISLSKILLLIAFTYLGFKSESVVLAFLFSYLIAVVVAVLQAFVRIAPISFPKQSSPTPSDTKDERKIIGFSLANYGSNTIVKIKTTLPLLIIGLYSMSVVPLYNIAYLVTASTITLVSTVGIVFIPAVSKEMRSSLEKASELVNPVFATALMAAGPLFIALIVFPSNLLSLVSSEYVSAAPAMRILAMGAIFVSFGAILQSLLNASGKAKLVLGATAVYTAIEMISAYALINSYGMLGAAFSFLISGLINSSISMYFVSHTGLSIDFGRLLKPLFCIGFACALGLMLLNVMAQPVIPVALITGATYLGIARFSRAFGATEFNILWNAIKGSVGF
ncbi:MAG: oligosaccharide flippase family protein [Thaumarchaeota archaeon]|nr:oligosaccharide flippase family protein [Nitrososphaerota archaeon]MCL5317485.1 oligosaccharide flippase family protein [Nitrososphaerota archaeon]